MDAAYVLAMADVSPSNPEWWPLAFSALAAFIASLLLAILVRRWHLEDKRTEREQAALKAELAQLGLGLATEREYREAAITREAAERRTDCAGLGRDISSIREAFAYYCGSSGKEKPWFGPGSGSGPGPGSGRD